MRTRSRYGKGGGRAAHHPTSHEKHLLRAGSARAWFPYEACPGMMVRRLCRAGAKQYEEHILLSGGIAVSVGELSRCSENFNIRNCRRDRTADYWAKAGRSMVCAKGGRAAR